MRERGVSMSSITYIASDYPIPEIQNPHERSLSINEALEMGLEVPEYLLKNGIDRNWKNAIHWADRGIHFNLDNGTIEDGDFDDDYAIIPIYPGRRDVHSEKKYKSRVECIWSIGRAKKILELISNLLDNTDEVEFWHIYMENGERPKIIYYDAKLSEFTPEDLIEISDLPTYDKGTIHHCVTIRK
ncbi:MAG: hypothetical protein IJN02_10515 [Bacteroidales bacterium]|nr:hypothetical protein [Bacteroidales bacterium]